MVLAALEKLFSGICPLLILIEKLGVFQIPLCRNSVFFFLNKFQLGYYKSVFLPSCHEGLYLWAADYPSVCSLV